MNITTLYHGGPLTKLNNMLSNGFRKPREHSAHGSNYGKTFGPGLYFTKSVDVARFYSDDGPILKIDLNKTLRLYEIKPISPNDKRKLSNLLKTREKVIKENYHGFIVNMKDKKGNVVETEIIIFDPTFIPKDNLELI